jgi:hypothetical protein
VSDQVTDRTPEQLDVLAGEKVAGTVDLGFVAQLEGEVVNVGVVGLQQVDGVVIAAATQEGEEIAAPVRHLEPEYVTIELHGPGHVGRMKRNVAELARHHSGVDAVVLGERVIREDLDAGPFGIGEHDRLRDARSDVAALLGFKPGLGQACR